MFCKKLTEMNENHKEDVKILREDFTEKFKQVRDEISVHFNKLWEAINKHDHTDKGKVIRND